MTNQCDHGHLRRVCEICQRDDEIERLRVEAEGLRWAYNTVTDDCRNLTEKVIPNIRAERDALLAERDALLKTLQWLDRWLGHKPMTECTAKIKAAIDAAKGEK